MKRQITWPTVRRSLVTLKVKPETILCQPFLLTEDGRQKKLPEHTFETTKIYVVEEDGAAPSDVGMVLCPQHDLLISVKIKRKLSGL